MEYIMCVFSDINEVSEWVNNYAEDHWTLHTLVPTHPNHGDGIRFTVVLQRDANP
jgi:hypothetical protein